MGERGKWSGRAAGHGGSATVSITEGEDRRGGDRHSGADGKYCCLNMHHRTISPRVCQASSTISVTVVRHTRISKKDKEKEHETVSVTETGEGWRRVGRTKVEKTTESDRSGKHVGLQKGVKKKVKKTENKTKTKSVLVWQSVRYTLTGKKNQ